MQKPLWNGTVFLNKDDRVLGVNAFPCRLILYGSLADKFDILNGNHVDAFSGVPVPRFENFREGYFRVRFHGVERACWFDTCVHLATLAESRFVW